MNPIGIGDSNFESPEESNTPEFCVYIANRPPLDEYQYLENIKPLSSGEVLYIGKSTGNHWRKIFNVYAKFVFAYQQSKTVEKHESWQDYRDECLLQDGSQLRLLFSKPDFENSSESVCHIIMGKQYAMDLGFHEDEHQGMVRIDKDFVIWPERRLIVCPYFDYRQLSNIKIEKLIQLVDQVMATKITG